MKGYTDTELRNFIRAILKERRKTPVFKFSFNHLKTNKMATAKKAAKKGAKKSAKKIVKKEGGPGLIAQIIELHKKGLENKDIIAKGFNKTTVSIQVSKYKRSKGKGQKAKAKGKKK